MTNRKKVSIRPSDATYQPLDTSSKREMSSLKDMGIDELTATYMAPPNDDAYFKFRSPPVAWFEASKEYSKPHLFVKTFSLVSSDQELRNYCENRSYISKVGGDIRLPSTIRDTVALFLNSRPKFSISRMTSVRKFINWNAWDKSILMGFSSMANDDYCITATTLWLVYSVKAMLTSERQPGYVLDLSKNLVEEWDKWLNWEVVKIGEFKEILDTITHHYTTTNVLNNI